MDKLDTNRAEATALCSGIIDSQLPNSTGVSVDLRSREKDGLVNLLRARVCNRDDNLHKTFDDAIVVELNGGEGGKQYLLMALRRTDNEILSDAVAPEMVGSTASVVVLSCCQIITSNYGDSRVVLYRKTQTITLLNSGSEGIVRIRLYVRCNLRRHSASPESSKLSDTTQVQRCRFKSHSIFSKTIPNECKVILNFGIVDF
ncbi:PPM-type phosphatase domain [Sesbania bispinosa]|nr:PPM-type phosphatase domain [Sesbania bispinosa]